MSVSSARNTRPIAHWPSRPSSLNRPTRLPSNLGARVTRELEPNETLPLLSLLSMLKPEAARRISARLK